MVTSHSTLEAARIEHRAALAALRAIDDGRRLAASNRLAAASEGARRALPRDADELLAKIDIGLAELQGSPGAAWLSSIRSDVFRLAGQIARPSQPIAIGDQVEATIDARLSYTIAEACELTGLSDTTIYRQHHAGELTLHKIGRRTIVLADDVRKLLAESPSVPRSSDGKASRRR